MGGGFRDNLFSIFVDNLNAKVDYECLWGLFKPFGKVRDVFLSAEKSTRSSKFAFVCFVRFETMEEANKVAKTTNGMHVYNWPIVTKMASYDWNKRRSSMVEQNRGEKAQQGRGRGANVQNVVSENISFVEALRGSKDNRIEDEKFFSMTWDVLQKDKDWLNRSVVGILKDFSEISRVNDRLSNNGIEFPSSYIGDKSIL